MGLLSRIKLLAKLSGSQAEEPSRELGDLIEPGSSGEFPGTAAPGAGGGVAGLDHLSELRAAGLIDAETFDLIESTMTNPTAELDRLRASGLMSDEVHAQAMASMSAATSASGSSIDAAELALLQHGESAPATVLALPKPDDEANPRSLLTLEVHPPSGEPYQAECAVPTAHPPGVRELRVGDFLPVKVDPADPKRIAVDWSGFFS